MKTHLLCSWKNPIFGKILWYGPKCSRPVRLHNFLTNHISRTNKWKSLIFCMLIQVHIYYIESWSNNFWLGMGRNGRGQSGHGTLRLTVSQKWIDGMNWYFVCWCKFTLQSCFNDFWVGVVRNRCDHLVYETLTSAWSKEWVYEWSWFSACWLWGINFWLGRHCTLYLWLLNASPLQLYLLDPWQ